jgi:hypothetical protein
MFCSPKILAVRHCSEAEKNFLRFLVTIFQKTGIEETNLLRVYRWGFGGFGVATFGFTFLFNWLFCKKIGFFCPKFC